MAQVATGTSLCHAVKVIQIHEFQKIVYETLFVLHYLLQNQIIQLNLFNGNSSLV